ncbi:MAG: adaptor protein MecA [Clostridium sp.]|nr:adaptor protein MecA [Clostridium sp.]
MHIVEEDTYKVSCHIDRRDLRAYGITADDIINRTPLGGLFIKKAAELAKESTDYEWPGCAFSMQIDMYADDFVLVFSERIDDYLYNLRQSMLALPKEQAGLLDKMIVMVSMAEEEEARRIIRNFETNVRES